MYDRYVENCPFSEDELRVFDLCRRGESIVSISMKLNMSPSCVSDKIAEIKRMIEEEDRLYLASNTA